jgi:hypothetical protein
MDGVFKLKNLRFEVTWQWLPAEREGD